MQPIEYVEINEYGSAVIAGTRIHVEAVGVAYEGGSTEQEILEWFKIDRIQFHGALAYFFQHRDEIEQRIQSRIQEAIDDGTLEINKLERLRQNLRDKNNE